MTGHDVRGHAIWSQWARASGLMFAHDDLSLIRLHISPTIPDERGAVDRGDSKPFFRLAPIGDWS